MSHDDRTHPASPRRRREARRRGQVWQSSDLAAALMTGGVAILLIWQGPALVRSCAAMLQRSLAGEPILRTDDLSVMVSDRVWSSLAISAGMLLAGVWILALSVRLVQVGPLFAPALARPQAERISPLAGLRRLFSAQAFVRAPLWLLRVVAIGGLLWWTLVCEAELIGGLIQLPPSSLALALGELITKFALRLAGVLLVSSAFDAGWQWFAHQRRLRMTTAEIRAEQREASRPQVRRPGGQVVRGETATEQTPAV